MASLIYISILLGSITGILIYHVNKYMDLKYKYKDLEIKNKKFELFSTVDVEKINKYIDDYIEGYVNRYAINKFIANNAIYIREQEQAEMIKSITKNIALDISELYIHYISLISSIDNDEDLIKFINQKVKYSVINFAANYNMQQETNTKMTKIL